MHVCNRHNLTSWCGHLILFFSFCAEETCYHWKGILDLQVFYERCNNLSTTLTFFLLFIGGICVYTGRTPESSIIVIPTILEVFHVRNQARYSIKPTTAKLGCPVVHTTRLGNPSFIRKGSYCALSIACKCIFLLFLFLL